MKKILFYLFLLSFSITSNGQNLKSISIKIPHSKKGTAYLTDVLIDNKTNIGVFEFNYFKGRLSNTQYVVLDLNNFTLKSSFEFKNWTYLYSSWFKNDSLLCISKGRLFKKKSVVNINTGEKIETKFEKKLKKPESQNTTLCYIDSQALYCTNRIVYWNNNRIFFDSKTHSILIEKEKQ
jgi:hypothetical protein